MNTRKRPAIIAIVGPTASGKSALGVALALKFNGEVVSADSRQVYRGLDIATGKITRREMRGIPHHLLDVASPRRQFSVADYKRRAEAAVSDIVRRGKLPLLVGGTGLYLDAVAEGMEFPDVPPDDKLRKTLAKKTSVERSRILKRLDPKRWQAIDLNNPRRVIRAIEIAKALRHVPEIRKHKRYDVLYLAPKRTPQELRARIKTATERRIRQGLVREAKNLLKSHSAKHLRSIALGYGPAIEAARGIISIDELRDRYATLDWRYAKRQMTWFGRNKAIHWVRNETKAARLVKKFLAGK